MRKKKTYYPNDNTNLETVIRRRRWQLGDTTSRENKRKCNVIFTIDIKNAINTVTWSQIINRLQELTISKYIINIIESY